MRLNFVIFLITTLFPIKCIRATHLKWFDYCHFLKGQFSIEMLSCGKCVVYDHLKFNLFRTEITASQGTANNSAQMSTKNINKNQINSKYCSFYNKKVNKYQHLLSDGQEEIPLFPELNSDWFQDLEYLIEKKEICTNLNDISSFTSGNIQANLKIIELINFGIDTVKPNSFKQFKNLRILSLAYNNLKTIDLATFTESPHLIELDLSFNKFNKIKLKHHFENLRILNFSNNYLESFSVDQTFSSRLQILDLSFNYLKQLKHFSQVNLNELVYLNLNNNYLKDLSEFFQMNKTDQLYNCNHPATVFNRMEMHINNNRWDCDCDTFDLIIRLNSVVENKENWQQWNEEHCKNISHEQEEEMNFPTKSTQSIVSSQFFFVWHSTPSTTINRGLNSTTKMLKYDMTTAFYWVTSFCVAVVTISCLFIIWFYCFKRFRFSRQLGLLSQQNRNNQLRNRQLNRHDLSRFSQRRSIYLVNPRLNNQPHNLNPNEILTPNMLVRNQVSSNNTSYPLAIYRHFRPTRQDTTASDLFFISLSNRQNLTRINTVTPTAVGNLVEGFNQHENLAYLHDDEPPSYYDAVLVKDLRLPIANKDDNSPDLLNNPSNTVSTVQTHDSMANNSNEEPNENITTLHTTATAI